MQYPMDRVEQDAEGGCLGVPCWMRAYFWDVDLSELDVTQNRDYIITRLLSLGDQHTLKWVFDTYERDVIAHVVKNSRGLLLKAAVFWQKYFNLSESEMRCFKVFEDMKNFYTF